MHDRLEDLFILDAEQAARELLIYGEGRSELPIDRLRGTTEYLAPLAQRDRHSVALSLAMGNLLWMLVLVVLPSAAPE